MHHVVSGVILRVDHAVAGHVSDRAFDLSGVALARAPAQHRTQVPRLFPAPQLLPVLSDHRHDVVQAVAEDLPRPLHQLLLSAIHDVILLWGARYGLWSDLWNLCVL